MSSSKEQPYELNNETVMKEKPTRQIRRAEERQKLKDAKKSFEAQLPYSYVLLKDGRQVELRRSMAHLKQLRGAKEAIILTVDGKRTAIPWESVDKISSKQF